MAYTIGQWKDYIDITFNLSVRLLNKAVFPVQLIDNRTQYSNLNENVELLCNNWILKTVLYTKIENGEQMRNSRFHHCISYENVYENKILEKIFCSKINTYTPMKFFIQIVLLQLC